MCSCSSRRKGSVSSRNASSSPARARASVCSVTLASSQSHVLSRTSQLRTCRLFEIRRSILAAADASTKATPESPTEGEQNMAKIVVSENVSLDGVVQDPTGEEGFRHGGWFSQFLGNDREAWGEVEFAEALGAEALLLGRRSDEYFGTRWSSRS